MRGARPWPAGAGPGVSVVGMPSVRPATAADRAPILATLTDAFARDPVIRWFFPDDQTYPARAAAFFGFLFDLRLRAGGAWVTDGAEATATW